MRAKFIIFRFMLHFLFRALWEYLNQRGEQDESLSALSRVGCNFACGSASATDSFSCPGVCERVIHSLPRLCIPQTRRRLTDLPIHARIPLFRMGAFPHTLRNSRPSDSADYCFGALRSSVHAFQEHSIADFPAPPCISPVTVGQLGTLFRF
jgi:hypothetical protein